MKNRSVLDAQLIPALTGLSRDTVIERFDQARIAYGLLNTVADLANHPHLRLITVQTPNGEIQMPAPPARINGEELSVKPVPDKGEEIN